MHEVLVNRIGGLNLPRKSVVRLTDRPNMTLEFYHGRKTTMQQQQQNLCILKKKEVSPAAGWQETSDMDKKTLN